MYSKVAEDSGRPCEDERGGKAGMKRINFGLLVLICLLAAAESGAACGSDGNGNFCESKINYVGSGSGGTDMLEGVVYVNIVGASPENGYWFWDNSSGKSLTLSTLLTARTAGLKVQIRFVDGAAGRGNKKITSVILLP